MFEPVFDLKNVVWFFVSMAVAGCGGAVAASGGSQLAREGQTPEVQRANEDPKVKEASIRCAKEIKDTDLQPPDSLEPIQVHACLYSIKPKIAACSQGIKRDVTLKIIIEKTGKVLNAFSIGDTADCPEAKCVADAVKEVVFPKFKGQTQQVIKYPFALGE
jgi:hypothetical protein